MRYVSKIAWRPGRGSCTIGGMPRFLVLAASLLAAATPRAEELPWFVLQVPASVTDLFVADSGEAALVRYTRGAGGGWAAETYYVSVGENGVGKQRAWDRKTPLGIYFVVDQLDTSRLHEKYGITAFPLDYPNVLDRAAGKTGDGIWVHGVAPGSGRRPERDTDGCLALANEDLARLVPAFVPGRTPVIVTRGIAAAETLPRQALRDELAGRLDAWASALGRGDFAAYESLYAPDFSYRGLDRDAWAALRRDGMAGDEAGAHDVDDVLLLADPENAGLYLARFRLLQSRAGRDVETTKRLYWRRDDEGLLKIVAEDIG